MIAKPEPRALVKRRRQRHEREVAAAIRALVSDRDGYCRLYWFDTGTRAKIAQLFGPCGGPSEWAHLTRRSATRGQPAGVRHTSGGTVMLCRSHHQREEAHKIWFSYQTARGADGPLSCSSKLGEFCEGESGVEELA